MTILRHDVKIDAPIESVWNAVADLVAVQHYNPMVASARCVSPQPEGVGATRRRALRAVLLHGIKSVAPRAASWSAWTRASSEAFRRAIERPRSYRRRSARGPGRRSRASYR